METEKYGHVSIARSVEYDFFSENEVAGSVKLNRFGEAFMKIDDEEQPLINNFQNGNFPVFMNAFFRSFLARVR